MDVPRPASLAGTRIPSGNLDDSDDFSDALDRLKNPWTKNFVVPFSAKEARVAFDLDGPQCEEVLQAHKHAHHEPKWFNFFAPHRQRDAIKVIARYYGFSPRLVALMSASPYVPFVASAGAPGRSNRLGGLRRKGADSQPPSSPRPSTVDEEKAASTDSSESTYPPPQEDVLNLNYYKLVDELWHYTSLDQGRRYLCLGFNTLHGPLRADIEASESESGARIVPQGKRVWSWLVLCDDGTVISIYEDPFPGSNNPVLPQKQQDLLEKIRRNITNVFRQLSKAEKARGTPNPLMILNLRQSIKFGEDGLSEQSEEFIAENGASLLFYYLFDDWYSSYGLVARQEHQYGAIMNELRQQMLERAELDYVKKLHRLGRELTVLKRMYQSYYQAINNVLERQKEREMLANGGGGGGGGGNHLLLEEQGLAMSGHEPRGLSQSPEGSAIFHHPTSSYMESKRRTFGPNLTPEAISRFERLRGRIQSYALNEIQDCLDEKESMAFMNFNLIAMKESRAVEHLTRITILLGKLTIIFLPVSLLTEYFSTDFPGMTRTLGAYWTSFGVIMSISILFIIGFGLVSGTLETKIIYRSLGRRAVDAIVGLYRRVTGRRKSEEKTT